MIGTAATAQAAPDGYTLMISSTAYHVIAPAVSANPGYDPLAWTSLTSPMSAVRPTWLVANPASCARSASWSRSAKRGEPIDYVSPGVGIASGTAGESFAQKAASIKLRRSAPGGVAGHDDRSAAVNAVGTMT
jgi:tripartite-type tricarboxylate transporter receptor subunit TctC